MRLFLQYVIMLAFISTENIYLFLIVIFSFHISATETFCSNNDKTAAGQKSSDILNFMNKFLQNRQCTFQLFFFQADYFSYDWLHNINLITSSLHSNHDGSHTVTISTVKSSISSSKKFTQPETTAYSKRCSFVLIFFNVKKFTNENDDALKDLTISPSIKPATIRNRDKYMFLVEPSLSRKVYDSDVFRSIKYKMVLEIKTQKSGQSPESTFKISLKQPCQYGLCNEKLCNYLEPIDFANSAHETLFPDHERNFHGHMLRLSTTTKVPQLLEMNIVKSKDGKEEYHPKRGLYAFVLDELSRKLNFTSEIKPSSGGGSTGHALPNGTWVGIVGDVKRGEVDFGFMAAITYSRFPHAEACAPINFAYIGFVTGPPRKTYAWNAILWPFQVVIWIGLILSIFISSIFVTLIYKVLLHTYRHAYAPRQSFNIANYYVKSIGMLTRVFLDQSNIPNDAYSAFRLFLSIWLCISLVISAAYQCKMVSLLTFPIYDHVPGSFDELAAARDFPVDFHYFGNVGYTYFKTSTNPSFVTIFKKMGKEPDPLKCLKRALTEKAACITFIITFQEILYRNLSDSFGKSPLKFNPHDGAMFPAGVIHQYRAPLSDNFKSILYPAMESGLIPFWQQEDLNQVLKNKNEWQKANKIDGNAAIWGNQIHVNDNLLRVRNLTGAFIIFGVGLTAAILAFVFETVRKYSKNDMSSLLMLKCGGQLQT